MSSASDEEKLQTGAAQFALKLTSNLYKKGENLVVSPFSLTYALSMLLAGADGESRKEILEALFTSNGHNLQQTDNVEIKFALMCQALVDQNAAVLKNTNLLYSQQGYPLRETFRQALQINFKAVAKVLDFGSGDAVVTINNDVKEATNGMIPKILDFVPSDTKLILGNAIYFKGIWKSKFQTKKTKPAEFHLTNGEKVTVPMMSEKSDKVPFYQDEKLKAVRLDYTTGSISMLLVLPQLPNTLESLLLDLHADKLKDIVRKTRAGMDVHLWLPKFKLEKSHHLLNVLSKLGVQQIFDRRANLSKIADNLQPLFVSEIIQSAVIEVNEEGTEAAAATLIQMRMMMIRETLEMKLDRPFLYFLVDRKRHALLFSGVVEDPSRQ